MSANEWIQQRRAGAVDRPEMWERALRERFGLTPAESRIVRHMAAAGGFMGMRQLCDMLGYPEGMEAAARSTLGAHLSNLRGKGVYIEAVKGPPVDGKRGPCVGRAFTWYDAFGPEQTVRRLAHRPPRGWRAAVAS
jgi:hypothetical protein